MLLPFHIVLLFLHIVAVVTLYCFVALYVVIHGIRHDVNAGDDECHAAAQQAQPSGAGDGLAHPGHVCLAAGHVHHWCCRLLSVDSKLVS